MAKLTARAAKFVHEYVWGEHAGNGTKCALLAGYSDADPAKYAYTLLRRPAVKALIEKESAEKEGQLKQKWTRVLEEAYHLAGSDITETVDEFERPIALQQLPVHVRRAIMSIEVETRYEGKGDDAEQYTVTKLKMHPKQPAIDFVAKVAGKLKDVVRHEVLSHADLILEADRRAREAAAKAAKPE